MIAIGLMVGSLLFAGLALLGLLEARQEATWLRAPAVVEMAGIKTDKEGCGRGRLCDYYRPLLKYHYTVGGHAYDGGTISTDFDGSRNREELQARLAHYPPGDTTEVYYDPSDPSRSALERASANDLPTLLALAGLCALCAVFLYRRSRAGAAQV